MPKVTRASLSFLSPPLAELERAARAAAAQAYAPYSRFRVGAAIWTDRGLFTGANVENASYGLSNCAERTAIFAAAAAGARKLSCVVVYTPTASPTAPCGACRQVMREFGAEARVISVCDGEGRSESTLNALLPSSFGPEDLAGAAEATPAVPPARAQRTVSARGRKPVRAVKIIK
jgi:cytidine deaminase